LSLIPPADGDDRRRRFCESPFRAGETARSFAPGSPYYIGGAALRTPGRGRSGPDDARLAERSAPMSSTFASPNQARRTRGSWATDEPPSRSVSTSGLRRWGRLRRPWVRRGRRGYRVRIWWRRWLRRGHRWDGLRHVCSFRRADSVRAAAYPRAQGQGQVGRNACEGRRRVTSEGCARASSGARSP
jgi:hypothetical protein